MAVLLLALNSHDGFQLYQFAFFASLRLNFRVAIRRRSPVY